MTPVSLQFASLRKAVSVHSRSDRYPENDKASTVPSGESLFEPARQVAISVPLESATTLEKVNSARSVPATPLDRMPFSIILIEFSAGDSQFN